MPEIEQRGTHTHKKKREDKIKDGAFGEKIFSLPTGTMCKALMEQNSSKES